MLSQAVSGSEALRDDLRQKFAAGSGIDVFTDTDNGAADKARFLQHELYEVIICQGVLLQAHFFKAGTSEIEHLRCRLPLEQVFYFRAVERVLEEVAFVDFKPFLQKKLSRFATRASRYPAVKIDLHVHGKSSSFFRFAKCFRSVSLRISRLPVLEHIINICWHIAHFCFSKKNKTLLSFLKQGDLALNRSTALPCNNCG